MVAGQAEQVFLAVSPVVGANVGSPGRLRGTREVAGDVFAEQRQHLDPVAEHDFTATGGGQHPAKTSARTEFDAAAARKKGSESLVDQALALQKPTKDDASVPHYGTCCALALGLAKESTHIVVFHHSLAKLQVLVELEADVNGICCWKGCDLPKYIVQFFC